MSTRSLDFLVWNNLFWYFKYYNMYFSHFLWDTKAVSFCSSPPFFSFSLSFIWLSLPPYFCLYFSQLVLSWQAFPMAWNMLPKKPRKVLELPPLKYSKGTWMWPLGTCFSGEHDSTGLLVGLSLRALFQPARFCGEMTLTPDCQIWLQGRQIIRGV